MILETGQADVEPRLVGKIGAAPDQDHVAVRALLVDMAARVLATDPFRFARGKRDLAVDRERQLQGDSRPAELEPGEPAGERSLRLRPADAERHFDPRRPQTLDPLARRAR